MLVISLSTTQHDVVIGLLSAFPFEGFQEFDDRVEAYIPEEDWEESNETISVLVHDLASIDSVSVMPGINWNETWESSFHPVVIDDYCAIRASFHEPIRTCQYEIVIDPKMAFGTGHHETTELMIRLMESVDLSGKSVLDMGAGTGILGILAVMQGAGEVTAVDKDPEAVSNTSENAIINGVIMKVLEGKTADFIGQRFDIIMANINRNVLLEIIPDLAMMVNPSGSILLSGYLETDCPMIHDVVVNQNLKLVREEVKGEWCASRLTPA